MFFLDNKYMKSLIKSIIVGIIIALLTSAFWIFINYWWHWFFIIGYVGIGWYIAKYYKGEEQKKLWQQAKKTNH